MPPLWMSIMKTNLKANCLLACAGLLCATTALPVMAQSHGGGGRGGGASAHTGSGRIAHGGRYDGRWQRGGPVWWGFGLGFGWGGAFYPDDPNYWSQSYYSNYDSAMLIDMPPSDFYVRPSQSVASNWYYCASARNYYPYIMQCPETWQLVPAPAPDAPN